LNNNLEIFKNTTSIHDEKSFGVFFDHFYPKLFRYAVYFVSQPKFAEEIVSDVLYKLLTRGKRLEGIDNINYYLYNAIKNQCITFLRDKNPMKIESDSHDDFFIGPVDPENQLVGQENLSWVEKKVNNLPARKQLVFRLVREEGMTFKEVGDLLDISPRTVETHLGLAIKDLCQSLNLFFRDKNSEMR
jgi:RNA polymerase sigma-70 factor (family 1)